MIWISSKIHLHSVVALGSSLAVGFLAGNPPVLLILLVLNARTLRNRQATAVDPIATHLAAQSNLLRLEPDGFLLGQRAALTALVDTGLLICLALNDGLFRLQAQGNYGGEKDYFDHFLMAPTAGLKATEKPKLRPFHELPIRRLIVARFQKAKAIGRQRVHVFFEVAPDARGRRDLL